MTQNPLKSAGLKMNEIHKLQHILGPHSASTTFYIFFLQIHIGFMTKWLYGVQST